MAAGNIEAGSVKPEARKRLMDSIAAQFARGNCVYAVLEGALFDDLPAQLGAAGIAHRSLYRGGDRSLVVGGPWLVDLSHFHPTDDDLYEALGDDSIKLKDEIVARPADPRIQTEALWQIVTDSRAAVFWIGNPSLTEGTLHTHLRTINEILVPGTATQVQERVTFRHADANVMAQVLPALDEEQFVRLLGPANSILFTPHEDWGGGLKRADRPDTTIAAPAGPLAFSAEQIEFMKETRLKKFDGELALALQQKYPDHQIGDDDALLDWVSVHRRQAQSLGIENEQHFMDYLDIVIARGDVRGDEQFQATMNRRGWLMEEKCRHLRSIYLPA
ncbi:DUF4123 domain-containing protein [Phyllobacterium sp. YR531]|uniref:DUF4123 domain-containing protein n=1 Tax=Phyllobacterium sp. YR531 TaxID=1144343 RepID=UPI000592E2D4|nr:DUF4123 domain-containing protein [Phyllobacterium sp. YR531]